MARDPETSLSLIRIGVTGDRPAQTGTALGYVVVRIARHRAADIGAALRLIDVGRDLCEATGHLRPALGEIDV